MESRHTSGGFKSRQLWCRAKGPQQDPGAEKLTRLWKSLEAPGSKDQENLETSLRPQQLGRSPWLCDVRAEAWRKAENGDRNRTLSCVQ